MPCLLAFLCLAAAATGAPAAPADTAGPAVVVLVRHAEKGAEPADDPPLTTAGVRRANALAEVLENATVDAIVTTHYRRTRETAAPLARSHGLGPLVVRATADTAAHVREVADLVRRQPPGALVVVVGHSNTVPAIVTALGGPRLEELCEGEYAHLFTLVRTGATARLLTSRYGAPDDSGSRPCARGMMQP